MESRFKEDMNMDSLDQIELMMLVEDEFGEIFFMQHARKEGWEE